MNRKTMASQQKDALPQAPHLAALAGVVPDRLAYAALPPRAYLLFIPADERRAILMIVGDDAGLAAGPTVLHRQTLRRMHGRAVFGGTQPQELAAGPRLAVWHARVPVEVSGSEVAAA
jgi:hypothetical protein